MSLKNTRLTLINNLSEFDLISMLRRGINLYPVLALINKTDKICMKYGHLLSSFRCLAHSTDTHVIFRSFCSIIIKI